MSSFRRFIPLLSCVLATFAVPSLHAQGSPDAQRSQNDQQVLAAQGAPSVPAAQAAEATQPTAGPTLARASVGVRTAKAAPAKTPPRFAETRQNEALMIVGGVALIVGAIIGDTPGTLIMVGGAGVGLYGLYKYLE